MGDRSFVRFGGLAAILLALTSWAAILTHHTAAQGGQDVVGVEVRQLLYALAAVWALFAIVALHWILRQHGEAWSFFALVVGVMASAFTITSSLYPVAFARHLVARPIDVDVPLPTAVPPTDPLNVMTFGLTGLWFLVANLLLWRAPVSRRLAALGLLAAAALFLGFLGALSARPALVSSAAIIAGAVCGPPYWLLLGIRLWRLPRATVTT